MNNVVQRELVLLDVLRLVRATLHWKYPHFAVRCDPRLLYHARLRILQRERATTHRRRTAIVGLHGLLLPLIPPKARGNP